MSNNTFVYGNKSPELMPTTKRLSDNLTHIKTFNDGESIVAMQEHDGFLLLATNKAFYVLEEDGKTFKAVEVKEQINGNSGRCE